MKVIKNVLLFIWAVALFYFWIVVGMSITPY